VLELLVGQGLLQEGEAGVGHGKTAVELATGDIDIQGLEKDQISLHVSIEYEVAVRDSKGA
jgi:hypothetical protein